VSNGDITAAVYLINYISRLLVVDLRHRVELQVRARARERLGSDVRAVLVRELAVTGVSDGDERRTRGRMYLA
jgi:hypothetical protein